MECKPLYFSLCVPLQYIVAQTADKGITMEFKDEQLPSIFKRLEKISKYKVLFTYEEISAYKATGKVENVTIEQFLKKVIGDKPLKYHIDGWFINVTLKGSGKKTVSKVRGNVISACEGIAEATTFACSARLSGKE